VQTLRRAAEIECLGQHGKMADAAQIHGTRIL
jgi:hypothetical protein